MRKRMCECDQKGSSARPCQTGGVVFLSKTTMRLSGLPEGHSIARATAHDCDCHVRRLTSRIGGWSDGKETTEERAASRAGESKILQARSPKSWRSNSVGTGIVGVQARRFPDRATALSGQTPNFCWTSPQRGKEQRTKAPHPRKAQQSFSSFSCSFLLSITTSSTANAANMLIYKVRLFDCWKELLSFELLQFFTCWSSNRRSS
jgi:hypothetical protein